MRVAGSRCLLVFLALCLAAQASALVVHAPVVITADAMPEGERGGDHAPDGCDVCQVLSQAKVHAPVTASPFVPLAGRVMHGFAGERDPREAGCDLSTSPPRAPPSPRSPES